jgi:fructosamine-3-kinase
MDDTFRKHDPSAPDGFFEAEAAGLDWLREAGAVAIPLVRSVGADHIELEHIDHGRWSDTADERFGRELAAMHRAGADAFGARWPGFIGPLPMPNDLAQSWPAFYASCRVEPFLRGVPREARDPFARVLARIDDLCGPAEPAARIHGDLWRGNALVDATGTPWLIDPAAHGGHRETDLAMMRLFGGFGDRCFAAYDESFPLADGWRDRVALHQLHPLLVHAVLFGGSYVSQAVAAARHYG